MCRTRARCSKGGRESDTYVLVFHHDTAHALIKRKGSSFCKTANAHRQCMQAVLEALSAKQHVVLVHVFRPRSSAAGDSLRLRPSLLQEHITLLEELLVHSFRNLRGLRQRGRDRYYDQSRGEYEHESKTYGSAQASKQARHPCTTEASKTGPL